MMLFRNAEPKDLDAIYQLALNSGIGVTTLPKDKEFLQQRLELAANSFKKELRQPAGEYYFFVLEDQTDKKIIGTSAIEASLGYDLAFYSYKLTQHTTISQTPPLRHDFNMLNLVNDYEGHSELCTLFLEPYFRKQHNGLLLSLARFLFMAQHPHRFHATVIAELRGVSNDKGDSPFWNGLGRHFFRLTFAEVDRLTTSTNKQFIADLMPKHPIYVELLPKDAQKVIGQPHPSTRPALAILEREGFSYNNYIDIFDGGPTIEAPLLHIRTIAASRLWQIQSINENVHSLPFVIANTELHFKATISSISCNEDSKMCIINKNTADLLKLERGDYLRAATLP